MFEPMPSGVYVSSRTSGEAVQAFVPDALPPQFDLQARGFHLMERANRALGRLDGITALLPNTDIFIYAYVRKEALLSSQIEGTQSSISDLLLYENRQVPGVPVEDVVEVSNYVRAMNHGLDRIAGGFPLSLRLVREIHGQLLARGRGSDKQPGEFRCTQNWIGGSRPGNARYVPPPPNQMIGCLNELERFFHINEIPTLLKAAFVHAQFETIHPFLDGNGRIGRLLITLLLCVEQALKDPILYLSLYFKTHRDEYYDLLQRIRTESAWREWIHFFLSGVEATSNQAVDTARESLSLFENDRRTIEMRAGRSVGSTLRVHEVLQKYPLVSIKQIAQQIDLTWPTVSTALERLQQLGMIREITGQLRGRMYLYTDYMEILDRGTEPM